MNAKLLAYVVPLVLVWGSMSGVLMIPLKRLATPLAVFLNLSTGLLFMTGYLACTGRFRTLRSFSRATWGRLMLAGMIGSFLYYAVYFSGLKMAGADSAIEVSMMNYLFPIMTVIFSALILRERVTGLGFLSIVISFSGAYVIVTHGDVLNLHFTAWRACLLGLAAAVSWGFFSALGRKWAAEPIAAVFVYGLGGLLLSVPWMLWSWKDLSMPTWTDFGCLAYDGIVANCIGVILWFKALQVSNATLVGNITYSAAFLSVLSLHLMAHSPVRASSLVGLCLITVGVLIASRWGHARLAQPMATPRP